MEKIVKPNIEGEMDEFQRLSQDLKRDEDIDVSVDEIVNAFNNSKEETLTDDIWVNLENTESNEVEKGDWDTVMGIAKTYKKTNPIKLKKSIRDGDYSRPLIVKIGDRYILVAGNTRLCTAAAMGVNPKVFIANINGDKELNEKWSQKYKNSIDCNNPKGFSQRAHCQGKKKVNEDESLAGGNADNMTLVKLAKKHDAKGYYHILDMVKSLKKELDMGVGIEMEHTKDESVAMEIALDHLWEDPSYYSKLKKMEIDEKEVKGNKKIDKNLTNNQQEMVYGIVDIVKKIKNIDNRKSVAKDMIKKFKEENIKFDYDEFLNMCGCVDEIETKEQTMASSSGSYEGNAFGPMIKREIHKIHNSKLNEEQEIDEVTDASSSGQYDVPLFGGTKGRKNPLSIGGPDTIYKGRAVKDKKFPKWGGPDSVFVKVKEKCKKFPYCNQGNTGAIELVKEDEEIKTAITETSKKYGIPYEELEKIVLNEISKIFI